MHLVEVGRDENEGLLSICRGAALVVLFAGGEELRHLREVGSGALPIDPCYSISTEDAYLVLPDDIGDEIVDILRDGDAELLHEAMDESLLVTGRIRHREGMGPEIMALACMTPRAALERPMAYAVDLDLPVGEDPLPLINSQAHLQCTTLSALLDLDGLESVLGQPEHIGASWRVDPRIEGLGHIESTHLWSRHLGAGRVGIELALFAEEGELVALLRPLSMTRVGATRLEPGPGMGLVL